MLALRDYFCWMGTKIVLNNQYVISDLPLTALPLFFIKYASHQKVFKERF
jgi:hypothetical protein